MGRQIMKQSNGKYAIWSTIIDNFIASDCTKKDVIDLMVKEYRKNLKVQINKITSLLDEGKKPYFQFTKSIDEALDTIRRVHGDSEVERAKIFLGIKV
jgi:hypothetical protein